MTRKLLRKQSSVSSPIIQNLESVTKTIDMGIFTTYDVPKEALKPSAPYKLEPKEMETEQPTDELKKQVERLKKEVELLKKQQENK